MSGSQSCRLQWSNLIFVDVVRGAWTLRGHDSGPMAKNRSQHEKGGMYFNIENGSLQKSHRGRELARRINQHGFSFIGGKYESKYEAIAMATTAVAVIVAHDDG